MVKTAVLLPGLDGSGIMFAPLVKLLSGHYQCSVVNYPKDELLDYAQLTTLVFSHLPEKEDFILVAESFAGPIAYLLAQNPPPNLKLIIYGASFIENPNKMLLKMRFLIPFIIKLSRYLPDFLFNLLLFGIKASGELARPMKAIIEDFPLNTFKHRLNLLADLSLPSERSDIEAIYIRPKSDFLVTNDGYESVVKRHDTKKYIVPGTHFIFQSNPDECARIILTTHRLSR